MCRAEIVSGANANSQNLLGSKHSKGSTDRYHDSTIRASVYTFGGIIRRYLRKSLFAQKDLKYHFQMLVRLGIMAF